MCAALPPISQPNALLAAALGQFAVSPVDQVKAVIGSTLQAWGNGYLLSVKASGSYAKGTAVSGGTDVDLFCSLSSTVPDSLEAIQVSLFNAFMLAGYNPKRQNVSVGLNVGRFKVDVTPGRRRGGIGNDHSLYSYKAKSWIQTNIDEQIRYVRQSNRIPEIRYLKSWRNSLRLEWPSFHLELFTIRSLRGRHSGNYVSNIVTVLNDLTANLNCTLFDPSNTNNDVSSTMTFNEKLNLSDAAAAKLQQIRFFGL